MAYFNSKLTKDSKVLALDDGEYNNLFIIWYKYTRHPFSFRLSSCRTNISQFSVFFQGPKFFNPLSSAIVLETTSLASFKNNLKHFFINYKVPNQSIFSTYLCDMGDFFKSLWMIVLLFVKLPFEVRFLLAVAPRAKESFVVALDSSHITLGWPVLRHAQLKGIPLGSNNMVLLVSAHSTAGLEGKLWKRVKIGFYSSGKNNTFNAIKLLKSIRHHSKLQASLKILKLKKIF